MIRSAHCKFLRGEFAKNENSEFGNFTSASATRDLSENEAGLGKCAPVVSLPR